MRNREHAKRSRVRKKFLLESLQEEVRGLQEDNKRLRLKIQKELPGKASKILEECCGLSCLFDDSPKEDRKESVLDSSDFNLISSLNTGQQNFVLSDPRLPDNPIVFASPGFYNLTGYTKEQVRLDEERSDELATPSQVTKSPRARTSVQDTPPP